MPASQVTMTLSKDRNTYPFINHDTLALFHRDIGGTYTPWSFRGYLWLLPLLRGLGLNAQGMHCCPQLILQQIIHHPYIQSWKQSLIPAGWDTVSIKERLVIELLWYYHYFKVSFWAFWHFVFVALVDYIQMHWGKGFLQFLRDLLCYRSTFHFIYISTYTWKLVF